MKFPIREVDELEVTVLVANDSGWGYGLRGTHGVALLVRTRYRDQWSTILLDVGPDADLLLNNMEKLGIAPSEVDSIVLSHNHYDHAGGLVGTVEAIGRQGIPIVTHPAAFRTSFVPGQALRVIDSLTADRPAVMAAGGAFLPVSEPMEVAPGVFTSGTVARETGEPTGISSKVVTDDGTWHDDAVLDDQAVLVCVKGEGVAILTGCAHSGIVNILRHSVKLTEGRPVSLVLGGFHLVNASEDRLAMTLSEFSSLRPGLVVSGHCTGFKAEAAFARALGERYRHLSVGLTLRFPSAG